MPVQVSNLACSWFFDGNEMKMKMKLTRKQFKKFWIAACDFSDAGQVGDHLTKLQGKENSMEISRKRYEELLRAEAKLGLLEEHGVDNWEYYDDAISGIDEALKLNLQELDDE